MLFFDGSAGLLMFISLFAPDVTAVLACTLSSRMKGKLDINLCHQKNLIINI